MRKSGLTIGVFLVATFLNSCWFAKPRAVFMPPPPAPRSSTSLELVRLPAPPAIEGIAHLPPQLPELSVAVDIAPPIDHAAPRHSAPAPVHATPPPAAAEPPTPPLLAPVLPPDTRRAYTKELDDSLERVRRALDVLATRNLSAEQANIKEQISTFKKQAEQYREQDLVLAKNLAERADKLAQDLLARIGQ